MNFEKIVQQARTSKFGLIKLNFGLGMLIPFNKPHGIKIKEITDHRITTIIPYKRRNLNHIKGIHACGMATAAEFASGFLLLMKLGNKDYRLIMQSIKMEYHYQAKKHVVAQFNATDEWLNEHVIQPLKQQDAVLVQCQIELHDNAQNHVATGYTNWQIKRWDKVKTKL